MPHRSHLQPAGVLEFLRSYGQKALLSDKCLHDRDIKRAAAEIENKQVGPGKFSPVVSEYTHQKAESWGQCEFFWSRPYLSKHRGRRRVVFVGAVIWRTLGPPLWARCRSS